MTESACILTVYHKPHWWCSEQEPYDLWNMPPGAPAQSNQVNHNHITQARKRRSVLTVAQSGFIRHITPGRSHPSHSPRSHTLLTKDQNLISRKSGSRPPRRPEDLTVTPPKSRRVKLSTQPLDTFTAAEGGEKRGLCPGFITAAQLGSHAESQFSTFFCLIFYSLF